MLIVTPRHRPDDLERWRMYERIDELNARRLRAKLDAKVAAARDVMRDFIRAGDGYLGVSWGKDSVVVAWLLAQLEREEGIVYPVVWVRVRLWENPDCVLVRAAFLARWPLARYEEIEVDEDPTLPTGWNVAGDSVLGGFREAARRFGDRHISGVRAAESATRRMSVGHLGLTTRRTCRPIGRWTTEDVYTLIHIEGLPLHPAYGYTMGGIYDRQRLRCDAIGGETGQSHGRDAWEHAYYPDVWAAAARGGVEP